MKKTLLVLVAGVLLLPALSQAAFWKAGEEVSIPASPQPVADNAYLAGNLVTVSGPVSGDLFAAGNTVSLSGKVSRDIMAAGSLVNIVGVTAEDVRVAGSNVNLDGAFSGELLAAGAQVIVASGAAIAKDTYLTGSILSFNGQSAGSVSLSGEKVSMNGSVGKNLVVKTSGVLVIGPQAVVKGNLDYSSPSEAAIDPAAKISGQVNYHKVEGGRNHARAALAGFLTTIFFVKLLAILLAVYLLWYLRRKDSLEVLGHSLAKFGLSLLRGFIFLVVVPAAIFILCVTLIGAPIGIFAGLLYAAILLLASPFAILLAASLIMKKKIDLQWYHILLGALVLVVLKVIPIIGWLAVFIVYLAALGGLITALRTRFRR